ncbi:hypothetical protein [Anaerobacterium chartisolvens]|nr:hypothetical protein [Anaerobacterium chartisolvens]
MLRFKKILAQLVIIVLIFSMIAVSNVSTVAAANVNLNDPVFDFNRILFVKHQPYPDNKGTNTLTGYSEQHMIDQYFGFNGVPGGGIFILNNAFSGTKSVTNVLANSVCTNGRYRGQKLNESTGSFLSPDLSYDGKQILFAYTDSQRNSWGVWNERTTYHIFKVNIDGTGLTQLTDGKTNDFDPCWLPNGNIVYISEKRGGYGRCHQRIVPDYTLTTMNPDGSNQRIISYHETNEWNPSVDNNGMVIYTRWDYVDRGATHPHSGWITTPDGLDARPIALNYPNSGADWFRNKPLMTMSLRAIPDSNKYVAVAAPHHGQNFGSIIIVDPDIEDDDNLSCIKNITPDNGGYPESGNGSLDYATPYALSEKYFLVAHDPNKTSINNKRTGIYAIDDSGNKTLLYNDSSISCQDPIPVRARTKPIEVTISSAPAGSPPDGVVGLANVYDSLLPMPQGTVITQLRIWQVYPKTTPLATNPKVSYESTESLWAGRNTRGVLGTVPVESDGSAYFYLPANKCVFFQAVAADGTAVQSMRSDAFIVGGQGYLYCQGCHEPRHEAPPVGRAEPLAFHRAPSKITPDPAPGSRPMSFPRLIQPVLDSKCISCHGGNRTPDLRKGSVSSNGWFQSYENLRPYVFLFDSLYAPNANWDHVYPRTEPGRFGAKQSRLYPRLAGGHGNLTAAELHRFAIWLDSGVAPFYGEYNNTSKQLNGEQVEPILD